MPPPAAFAIRCSGPYLSARASSSRPGKRLQKATSRLDNIELTFLGTSSGSPSLTRNQQALTVQLGGQTWQFDCGEATQHKMMQTSLAPPAVKRVFISHLHGDHCFGLPGFLCNMATAYGGGEDGDGRGRSEIDETPVTIVGPEGLRSWLRAVLGNSYATLGRMKLEVHELVGMRAIENERQRRMRPPVYVRDPLPCEVPGLDLEPCADGVWRIPERLDASGRSLDPPMSISAVELDHTVPTVGWVLQEAPRAGTLDGARVKPLLQAQGVHLRNLKRLKDGESLKLPDGTVLNPSDFMGSSTSRKLCILSDMRGAKVNSTLYDEIADANLIVHECTNAFLPDAPESRSPRDVEMIARRHGHSTPQMAGRLARQARARHLVLTHFSPRYGGGRSAGERRVMEAIRKHAEREFAGGDQGERSGGGVTAAADLMRISVQINGRVDVDDSLILGRGAVGSAYGGAYGGAYGSSGSSEDDPAGLEAGPDEPERLERMQDGVEVSMQDTDEIGAVEQEGEQPDPIIERAEEPPPPPARRPRGRPRKNKE